MIFFIRGRQLESMSDINEQLFRLIWHVKHNINAPSNLKVGFVDIIDNGELLKETFDITEVPSIRYVFGGKFHTLKWKPTGHLWSAADIVVFVSEIDKNRLWAFERKRV